MYALSWFWPQYSDNISKQMFHMVYIKWYAVKLTKYTNLNMKDVFFDVLGNGNTQKNGCIYIKNGQRMTQKICNSYITSTKSWDIHTQGIM